MAEDFFHRISNTVWVNWFLWLFHLTISWHWWLVRFFIAEWRREIDRCFNPTLYGFCLWRIIGALLTGLIWSPQTSALRTSKCDFWVMWTGLPGSELRSLRSTCISDWFSCWYEPEWWYCWGDWWTPEFWRPWWEDSCCCWYFLAEIAVLVDRATLGERQDFDHETYISCWKHHGHSQECIVFL